MIMETFGMICVYSLDCVKICQCVQFSPTYNMEIILQKKAVSKARHLRLLYIPGTSSYCYEIFPLTFIALFWLVLSWCILFFFFPVNLSMFLCLRCNPLRCSE